MRQAFRTPGFARLYAGLTTSMFGDSVMLLVLSIWVKTLTGSNALAGLTFFFMAIPNLLAPVAGVWIDRVRRTSLLVWGHVASAAVVAPLLLVRGPGDVWLIYLVAFLYGVSFVVLPAALNGLLKELIPEDLLVEANGSLQTTRESFRLVGPIIGAALFAWWGAWPVIALDAASFLVAGAVIASLRVAEAHPEPQEGSFARRMADGVRFLRGDRILTHVLVGLGMTMLVMGFTEASIYALLDSFGKPATFAGVVVTVMGVGAIAGGLLSPTIIRRTGEIGATVLALALLTGAVAGTVVAPTVTVLLVLTVPIGAAIPLFAIATMTLLQQRTPQRVMGRVSTAADVIMAAPQTTSLAVGAILVSVIDWRAIFAIIAVVTGLGALYITVMLRAELSARIGRRDLPADPSATSGLLEPLD